MNFKLPRFIKILFSLCSSLIVVALILFSIFIAPYRTLPILMYHSIPAIEEKNNILSLEVDMFRKQMEYISKRGLYVASLKEVAKKIREGTDLPHNWITLTFDDGYRDFYTQAYPILKKEQFKATVFVIINSLDRNKERLSWQQVEQLSKGDLVDIGAHTLSHSLLPLLSIKEIRNEVFLPKHILEKRLKKSIDAFCYPSGALDGSIKKIVKEAGYKVAVGTAYQKGEFKDNDVYILKRIFVSKVSKFPFIFKFMLSGYYVPTREFVLRVLNIKTPRILYAAKKRRHNLQ